MRSSYCAAALLFHVEIYYFKIKIQNFFSNNISNSFFAILQIIFLRCIVYIIYIRIYSIRTELNTNIIAISTRLV